MTDHKIIVDCFAGGGGASTGIEMALGRSPDVAINHDAVALALHEANHPQTEHLVNDIWGVDPLSVHPGRRIGLLWASPDCKHFSKAKGGAPKDRNIRDLAWVVVDWAEKRKPDVIIIENVEEFVTWGPVDDDGAPIKWLAGHTFEAWLTRLRKAGYRVEHRELRACDYGAPTIRKRLFVVMRRDGGKIVWPAPTHGNPKSAAVRAGRLKPWRTAAEIIDWSLPCPSIFDTASEIMAKHGLRAVRPLAENTGARIARGVKRYVLEAAEPFVVVFRHQQDGRAINKPVPTVTANSDIKKPGGAAPLGVVAPTIMRHFGTSTGRGIGAPLGTVTADGGGKSALITPVLTAAQHGGSVRPIDGPVHTVTASAKDQNAVIVPTLVQTGYGEREGQAPRALDIGAPLGTVVAGGAKHAVVAPHIMTMRNAGKPFNGADEPTHTVTAGGAGLSVVAGFLAQHNGGPRNDNAAGHDAREPVSTLTVRGSQQNVVAGALVKYYGTGDLAQALPAAPPFGPEHEARAREVAGFLRHFGAWDEREFVTVAIAGFEFVVADIGMRMLTPRELFRAQGFPDDYEIERGPNGRVFTKSDQIHKCGNSVAPPMAAALAGANCPHMAAGRAVA